jgi:predicted RNA-binding Zn-ribbon protein involved in translation (DUF1610 family)
VTDSEKQPPLEAAGAVFECPHCGSPQLVHIRPNEVVAIYHCPKCGELVAPVKNETR